MSDNCRIPCDSCKLLKTCKHTFNYLIVSEQVLDLSRYSRNFVDGFKVNLKCDYYESNSEQTIGEIVDGMTNEQKKALYFLVGKAVEYDEQDVL